MFLVVTLRRGWNQSWEGRLLPAWTLTFLSRLSAERVECIEHQLQLVAYLFQTLYGGVPT